MATSVVIFSIIALLQLAALLQLNARLLASLDRERELKCNKAKLESEIIRLSLKCVSLRMNIEILNRRLVKATGDAGYLTGEILDGEKSNDA